MLTSKCRNDMISVKKKKRPLIKMKYESLTHCWCFLLFARDLKKIVLDLPWPVVFGNFVPLYTPFSLTGIFYLSHAASLWPVWLNPLSPSFLNLYVNLRKSFPISSLFSLTLPTPSATTPWWWSVHPLHTPVCVLGLLICCSLWPQTMRF